MSSLKIALLQIMPGATVEENLDIGVAACRSAAQMGADIALFPEMWSCGYEIPEDTASLNGLAQPRDGDPMGKPDCNGNSTVFDGIAYRPDVSGSCDTQIVNAGERETICLAELDLDELRDYRSREVHANAYRRPEIYSLLLSQTIRPPFIRQDRRKAYNEQME